MLSSVVSPATSSLPAANESYQYDALGNLRRITSPLQDSTLILSDAIGRQVRVSTPIDSVNFLVDSTGYDIMDRVVLTETRSPTMNGVSAQRLTVHQVYDSEGHLTSSTRLPRSGNSIEATGIDSITTVWKYDVTGHRFLTISPDQTPTTSADNPRDSVAYDAAGNPYLAIGRRGDTISTVYDALNRPVTIRYSAVRDSARWRGIPSVPALPHTCPTGSQDTSVIYHPYPTHPNDGACGYIIPADSATFAYDVMGNAIKSDNSDALVHRTYYANGQLKTDSLTIQTLARTGAPHVYVLTYTYDLDGRRASLAHPASIAPSSSPTTYTYDPITGATSTVTDPLGNVFQYGYDVRGQLTSFTVPGGTQTYGHDQKGRLTTYIADVPPAAGGRITSSRFTYDYRDKLLYGANSVALHDSVTNIYSGMGHLVASIQTATGVVQTGLPSIQLTASTYRYDAMGNNYIATPSSHDSTYDDRWFGGHLSEWGAKPDTALYEPYTGRETSTAQATFHTAFYFDRAGNVVQQTSSDTHDASRGDITSYFGSDGKLHALDRRNLTGAGGDYESVWEEYRYDALGRRVLVYTRHVCSTDEFECAQNLVRRTVWDGDQVLYEIQMQQVEAENDGTPQYIAALGKQGSYDPTPLTGRVLHTYGPTIDQPLSNIRMGYYGSGPFASIPLWDPSGRAPYVVFPSGSRSHLVNSSDTLGTAWLLGWKPYGTSVNGAVLDGHRNGMWMGSVMEDGHDASGLLYRRNRYYDPQTGRFTQEDPAGLGAGANAYGYANGDPVSYKDPFGLCPEPIRDANGRCPGGWTPRQWRMIETAIFMGDAQAAYDLNNALWNGLIVAGHTTNHMPAQETPDVNHPYITLDTLSNGDPRLMSDSGQPFAVDQGWSIGHEYGHYTDEETSMDTQKHHWAYWKAVADDDMKYAHDDRFYEKRADAYACAHFNSPSWRAYCTPEHLKQ
jgi:RHS repeat-associated protein